VKVGTQVAIGVAIGYVLGRTRKMRWAIGLVSAGTIGRVAKNPSELMAQGSKLLGASPQVKELTEDVRGRLMEAGKVAAMAAASNRINSLTDRLEERAGTLQQFRPSGGDEESYPEDREEERRPSARDERGQRPRRDDEEETRSARRIADEDALADEEEDEERYADEREPAMRSGRSRRVRRDDEDQAEEAQPPVRRTRRITDEDEVDDERSRRAPVRRARR